MGRIRTRSQRLNHYFGDMVDISRVEDALSLNIPTKREVSKTLIQIKEELGITQAVLFCGCGESARFK